MKKKSKTSRKRMLSVLLALAMVLSALPLTALSALAATSGDFEYAVLSETDKTCEITNYTGSATELAIPSELDGYTVTSIGSSAFWDFAVLTSITIPNSVTSIGDYAFYICTALTSVTIPNSVTSIGNYAFAGCASLTSITIPNSVTRIGGDTFVGCTTLVEIQVDAGNPNYASENGVLFDKDKTELICYPASKQDNSYAIPNSVRGIGENAFSGCATLTSITISNSVTSIGDFAFSSCTSLTSITIPDSVTSFGDWTFYYCTSLTSVTIGNGVTKIGDRAFMHCTSFTSITIPDGVREIGENAFSGCATLTSISIPDSVTKIGDSAFKACTELTSITLGNGVTSIGDYTFNYCFSLTSITLPNSVTEIGNEAFSDCSSLTSINISDSVTEISSSAFFNCTSLTSINIPNSVTSIGWGAFENCASLTSITIPDSVTRIGDYAFSASGLETVYGYTGSYADTYASENGYTFIALDLMKNDETDVSVVFPSENLPAENTVLNVEKLSAVENAITYDITLTVNGEVVQPASAVTVKIPVPEAMDGAQCKVYRQESDGTYTDMQATYQNGYMVFTTDHFSTYVLTTVDPNVPTYTLGDVNGDEKVNAVDARWVLQAASGARTFDATQTAAADVNGDGKINAVDARWILQAASGARVL